jgi:hypothetical protein
MMIVILTRIGRPHIDFFSAVLRNDPIGAILSAYTYTATFEEVDHQGRDIVSHLVTRPDKVWRYIMEELLERHPYMPVKDRYGRDALSWACSEGYQEAIDQLIRAGCSLRARDRQNWTPIHHVVANNRLDVLATLYNAHEKLFGEIIDSDFWDVLKSPDISSELLHFLWNRFQGMPTSESLRYANIAEKEHDIPSTRDEDTSTRKSEISKTGWLSEDKSTTTVKEFLNFGDEDWEEGESSRDTASLMNGKQTVNVEDDTSITKSEVSLHSEKSKVSDGKEEAMPSKRNEASQDEDLSSTKKLDSSEIYP